MVEDVVSLLTDLVRIPSVCGKENAIARFISDWFEKNQLSAQTIEVKPERPNVLAVLKGREPGPRILLNGHMDTVEAGHGWAHDPFGADIENGRMFGRGTIDMKSGLACILWAAAACREEALPKRGELIVAAVVDEEAYDLGAYSLVQHGITQGIDFALISEATDLKVVTAHKGRTVLEVEVRGRTVHSQRPDLGVNAIDKAALLVGSLSKIPRHNHPRMGGSMSNVLRIDGGQEEVMLVPDRCRVVIDISLPPGHSSEEALSDMKQLIRQLGIDAEAKFVARETPFCEPFEIADEDPHVQLALQAASKVLGTTVQTDFHDGPCDSCILVNQGHLPTIEFGPTGGRLHESEEYVEIESVRKTAEVYREIIRMTMS